MSKQELDLLVEETEDEVTRENIDRIRNFIAEDLFTKFDGGYYELSFEKAESNLLFPHRLNYVPRDLFITYESVPGATTINYSLNDFTNINFTTTGAVDIRFIAGSFRVN